MVSEISSGSVCFGGVGCGTSSSADATTTEIPDDESGPPKKKQKVGDSSASSIGETSRGNQGGGRLCRGHPCGSHGGHGSGSGQGSFHGGQYMDGIDFTDQNL